MIAPALAQADVAVAMNSGTQAAKEAGNMVDLDSSPTKLIEVVRIGKQLLMTRGATDHIFHCQRCSEVFRHHTGAVYGNLSKFGRSEYHASDKHDHGNSFRGYLQCLYHYRIDSLIPARREISGASGG